MARGGKNDVTVDRLLEETVVTFRAAGHEVLRPGERMEDLDDDERTSLAERERRAQEAFAGSVREETRSGPSLPAAGGKPTYEQLSAAFLALETADARLALLKADYKFQQAEFTERVAPLKEATEDRATKLQTLQDLGRGLKSGGPA